MTHDGSDSQHGATAEWDDRCIGWRGLWSRLLPFNALVVFFLYALFFVTWINRETLSIDEALKFALAIPSALLVFSLPQMRGIFTTGDSPYITSEPEQKLADWMRKGAMVSVLLILAHIALPNSEAKYAIGSLSSAIFVALVISIGFGRKIVSLIEESEARRQYDPLPLPPKAPTHGWITDALSWFMFALVSIPLTAALRVGAELEDENIRNLIWFTIAMGSYVIYYVFGLMYHRGTIGQYRAGSRVVRQTDGNRISLVRAILRAFLLFVPVYCLLAVSSVASLEEGPSDSGFLHLALEWIAIVSLLVLVSVGALSHVVLRDIHPRGQGVVDLCTGTMSVATTQADPEEPT